MAYDQFANTEAYASSHAGAALDILIYEEERPSRPIIGGATGLNVRNEFESILIEEVGNEGPSEIVQGRNTVQLNLQAFWTPQRGDNLPTRINFLGKTHTIYVAIAPERAPVVARPGAGETTDTFTGGKIANRGDAFGARGPRTLDLAFNCMFHYTGLQWFELAGSI